MLNVPFPLLIIQDNDVPKRFSGHPCGFPLESDFLFFFSESVLSSSLEAREACRSLNGSSVVFHDSPEEDRLQLRSRRALSKAESSTSGFLALFRPETVRHPPTLHLDTLGSSHHKTDRAESLQPGRYGNDSKIRPVVEKKRKEKHVQSFFFLLRAPVSVFVLVGALLQWRASP